MKNTKQFSFKKDVKLVMLIYLEAAQLLREVGGGGGDQFLLLLVV